MRTAGPSHSAEQRSTAGLAAEVRCSWRRRFGALFRAALFALLCAAWHAVVGQALLPPRVSTCVELAQVSRTAALVQHLRAMLMS